MGTICTHEFLPATGQIAEILEFLGIFDNLEVIHKFPQ
jgi:hypothetical protein